MSSLTINMPTLFFSGERLIGEEAEHVTRTSDADAQGCLIQTRRGV